MTGRDPRGRLRAILESMADEDAVRATAGRPVAIGWATVELERAESELAVALGLPAGGFVYAAPSVTLGAECRLAPGAFDDGIGLALLEPSTEGRLAASLARHDEGPVAVWFEVAGLEAAAEVLRRNGEATTVTVEGPLGPERLLLGGAIHGPYRLLVDRAGTIRA